jgi:hypothetical protein
MKAALAAACAARHEAMLESLTTGKRRCPECRLTLPLDGFAKNRSEPSGLSSWCRSCLALAGRRRYHERKRERQRVLAHMKMMRAASVAAIAARTAARVESGIKRCSHCHGVKNLDDFPRAPAKGDLHHAWCKGCVARNMRESRHAAEVRRKEEVRAAEEAQDDHAVALAKVAALTAEIQAQRAREEAHLRWLLGRGPHPDASVRQALEEITAARIAAAKNGSPITHVGTKGRREKAIVN